MDTDSICVLDFCGRCGPYYPVQFWGDYYPALKITVFGGDYYRIPDMPSDICPSDDQLNTWINQHDPRDLETIHRELISA
jgi:hypothetical protein